MIIKWLIFACNQEIYFKAVCALLCLVHSATYHLFFGLWNSNLAFLRSIELKSLIFESKLHVFVIKTVISSNLPKRIRVYCIFATVMSKLIFACNQWVYFKAVCASFCYLPPLLSHGPNPNLNCILQCTLLLHATLHCIAWLL